MSGLVCGIGLMFILNRQNEKTMKNTQKEVEEKMQIVFENIANKALKETSESFNSRQFETMQNLLIPFKEKVEQVKKDFENNNEKFSKLDYYIKNVIETGNKISRDTNSLSQALKGDNMKTGKWGELILSRVFEISGLKENEEYILQTQISTGRPDAIVLLPQERAVFVDAKTNLGIYDEIINCQDETKKEVLFKQFRTLVKNHISNLCSKEYFKDETYQSPQFVLMFIPIESCYMMLFANDSELWEFAWKNKIMPVSPSTLLSALKIINNFHTTTRQNKNAIEIANLAGRMIDKFVSLTDDVLQLDKNLEKMKTKLTGQGNLISQAKRLEELGVKVSKPFAMK